MWAVGEDFDTPLADVEVCVADFMPGFMRQQRFQPWKTYSRISKKRKIRH